MVFRARRASDGKEVAVKIPKSLSEAAGRSYLQEIFSWHRLSHENIAELYDLNITPVPYLETELCESGLDDLAKPLETREAACLVLQISEGLKHAHSQGIVHRDLKPQNILLRDGIPKITDWNVSILASEARGTDYYGFSPTYAAPEQLSPKELGKSDHRTDIYQLGVIFYELVAGKLPFKGDNMTELLARIKEVDPIVPTSAQVVEHIILKCLKNNMEDRYQSIEELQRDLHEYLNSVDAE